MFHDIDIHWTVRLYAAAANGNVLFESIVLVPNRDKQLSRKLLCTPTTSADRGYEESGLAFTSIVRQRQENHILRLRIVAAKTFLLQGLKYQQLNLAKPWNELTSLNRPKCFDSFSMTRLYGKCCVSFLPLNSQPVIPPRAHFTDLRGCTFNAWRASRVESRTFDE